MKISITIPAFNEEANIVQLFEELNRSLGSMRSVQWEVVFVDDGSTDQSHAVMRRLYEQNPDKVVVLRLARNYGQTAAMMAGFDHAKGDVIIPMDSDLQNDPADIPRLIEKLQEGFDVVSGWRKDRKDNPFLRTLPSKLANWIISKMSGVHLHDYGCSLKAYRRHVIEGVRLYGEMHRFIPVYAKWEGARVTELVVNHRPRVHGYSKYGLERVFKVVFDMVVVKFLNKYYQKPMYIFGTFGVGCLAIGFFSGLLALFLKYFRETSFIQTPLPLLSVTSAIMGGMCILLGLIAELNVRTYFESQNKSVYRLKSKSSDTQ